MISWLGVAMIPLKGLTNADIRDSAEALRCHGSSERDRYIRSWSLRHMLTTRSTSSWTQMTAMYSPFRAKQMQPLGTERQKNLAMGAQRTAI